MLWQRGHFWIAIARAVLCVLRARFFLFDVRLFGTAIVRRQLNVFSFREADRGLPATHPIGFQLLQEHSRMFRCSSPYRSPDIILCSPRGKEHSLGLQAARTLLPRVSSRASQQADRTD